MPRILFFIDLVLIYFLHFNLKLGLLQLDDFFIHQILVSIWSSMRVLVNEKQKRSEAIFLHGIHCILRDLAQDFLQDCGALFFEEDLARKKAMENIFVRLIDQIVLGLGHSHQLLDSFEIVACKGEDERSLSIVIWLVHVCSVLYEQSDHFINQCLILVLGLFPLFFGHFTPILMQCTHGAPNKLDRIMEWRFSLQISDPYVGVFLLNQVLYILKGIRGEFA